jgi:hypothetical protein
LGAYRGLHRLFATLALGRVLDIGDAGYLLRLYGMWLLLGATALGALAGFKAYQNARRPRPPAASFDHLVGAHQE